MDDGLQVQLLGCHQREALGQIKPHLIAKHRQGARAGAVGLADAMVHYMGDKIKILLHWPAPLRFRHI